MKTAAKIFIWIGMILQFFLIYPIIIGIIALRKIDDAYSSSELKGIGVATLFLCSVLGGIFMLCMSDSSLTGSYRYRSGASAGTVIVRILGVLFTLCGLFWIIWFPMLMLTETSIVSVPIGTLSPVYDYSGFIAFGCCALISLIITCIIICKLMFFKAETAPKVITCVILSVLTLSTMGIITFARLSALPREAEVAVQEELDRQADEEEKAAKLRAEQARVEKINTLKFTDMKISELIQASWRNPSLYNGATISLEGYATNVAANDFMLNFPGYDEKGNRSIYVTYEYGENQPRVLKDDYVIVTGVLSVKVYDKEDKYGKIETYLSIRIDASKCEVVPDPNK